MCPVYLPPMVVAVTPVPLRSSSEARRPGVAVTALFVESVDGGHVAYDGQRERIAVGAPVSGSMRLTARTKPVTAGARTMHLSYLDFLPELPLAIGPFGTRLLRS